MSERPPRPLQLKLLCLAYFTWSFLTLLADIHRWTNSPQEEAGFQFTSDIGMLGFPVAFGLGSYSPTAFSVARFLNWYWLLGSVLLFFQVFPMGGIKVTPSDFLANIPSLALRIFVIPFFLAQLWQRHVLKRPEMRALFQGPSTPSAAS
jgi:hypothetical protein